MTVLITGAGGQLGKALAEVAPRGVEVLSMIRAQLDIADDAAVESLFESVSPAIVFNAAAFTHVDAAEALPEHAARVNAIAPGVLARACRRSGAWLVHASTDYVFKGDCARAYETSSTADPLSVYGKTKLLGERAVAAELPERSTIVRTSWLYASHGENFVSRMLALMATRGEVAVVSDQVSAPTAAAGLAEVLWGMATRRLAGLYHWCDSGVASRYDFAVAIAEEAHVRGLLASRPRIVPIKSSDYPAAAPRPRFSLLDKSATEAVLSVRARPWRVELRAALSALRADAGVRA